MFSRIDVVYIGYFALVVCCAFALVETIGAKHRHALRTIDSYIYLASGDARCRIFHPFDRKSEVPFVRSRRKNTKDKASRSWIVDIKGMWIITRGVLLSFIGDISRNDISSCIKNIMLSFFTYLQVRINRRNLTWNLARHFK